MGLERIGILRSSSYEYDGMPISTECSGKLFRNYCHCVFFGVFFLPKVCLNVVDMDDEKISNEL